MTEMWNAQDEDPLAGWIDQANAAPVDSPEPLSHLAYGDSDLRFIDTVLADMIVFARLNRLSGLEDDLVATRARFAARSSQS